MFINTDNTKALLDTEEGCFIKWRITDWCNYRCSYCIRRSLTQESQDLQDKNLESSWKRTLEAAPEINRIINEFGKPTKIDLIGGEVSFFDLPVLIDLLDSKFLDRINITTNLSNKIEAYEALVEKCKQKNITLSITASFHFEYADLDTFISKAKVISCLIEKFKVEMVSALDNQEIVKKFLEKCKAENIKFIIEKDLTVPPPFNADLISGAISENSNDRYKLYTSDGNVNTFKTRNLLVAEGLPFTKGFRCTRDWNYVYIEMDQVFGHNENLKNLGCKCLVSLKDFHILKEPAVCLNPKCTLCGRMSLINENLLEDFLKKEGIFKKENTSI